MKKAILMMTFGSPEEISFEGVADFFTNIRRGVRPQDHEIQTLYDNYVLIDWNASAAYQSRRGGKGPSAFGWSMRFILPINSHVLLFLSD